MKAIAAVWIILALAGVSYYWASSFEEEKPNYQPCTEETKACVQAP